MLKARVSWRFFPNTIQYSHDNLAKPSSIPIITIIFPSYFHHDVIRTHYRSIIILPFQALGILPGAPGSSLVPSPRPVASVAAGAHAGGAAPSAAPSARQARGSAAPRRAAAPGEGGAGPSGAWESGLV